MHFSVLESYYCLKFCGEEKYVLMQSKRKNTTNETECVVYELVFKISNDFSEHINLCCALVTPVYNFIFTVLNNIGS